MHPARKRFGYPAHPDIHDAALTPPPPTMNAQDRVSKRGDNAGGRLRRLREGVGDGDGPTDSNGMKKWKHHELGIRGADEFIALVDKDPEIPRARVTRSGIMNPSTVEGVRSEGERC